MKKPKKRTTVLIDDLLNDPEYLGARESAEKIRLEEERLTRAEEPLVRELREAGTKVDSAWDLRITKRTAPRLVPILLKHLERPYPVRIREGIAHALVVSAARPWWHKLKDLFLAESGPADPELGINRVKWAIHMAVAATADASVVDELAELALDRRHGHHRQFFVDALAAIDEPRARAALQGLKDDAALADAFKRLAKRRKRRQKQRFVDVPFVGSDDPRYLH